MDNPNAHPAITELQKSLTELSSYVLHIFGCEIEQTDFCTCGMREAKQRVAKAFNNLVEELTEVKHGQP